VCCVESTATLQGVYNEDNEAQGHSMQYRVFYTDQPLPEGEYEPDHTQLVLVGYDTKDEAMDFACRLIGQRTGDAHPATVWKIEGPDGFVLERAAIELEYLRRTKP
jgi:hypothetical protein